MEQPNHIAYGLTQDDLRYIQDTLVLVNSNEAGTHWFEHVLPESELIGGLLFWTVLWPFFLIGLLATPIVNMVLMTRLRRSPNYSKYQQFSDAVQEYNRRQKVYWEGLTGHEFEYELAALFEDIGYNASVTKGSGDQGVDIFLRKSGEVTIVQCKRYRKSAGPAVVRELYGTLTSVGADHAILACTGGFTSGVHRFVKGKPISLLDLKDILIMQENVMGMHTEARPPDLVLHQ